MRGEYRRRYERAAGLLSDMGRAATVAQSAHNLSLSAEPSGRILINESVMRAHSRVGLLSGSFNPLTQAHVALGNAARSAGHLDGVLWSISAVAIEKEDVQRASLVDRLLQMAALVGNGPDACLLANRGLYVDLARIARTCLPHLSELVIIIGFDKIRQIFDPRYYHDRTRALDELFGLASFLVAPRGEDGAVALQALMRREDNRRYAARIAYCPLPARYRLDSSTQARAPYVAGSPDEDQRRQRALLAPEGLALANLPDVYNSMSSAHMSIKKPDAYDARLLAIERLGAAYEGDSAS